MNKLPSWRFWLPFFFQSALILMTPVQAIYTHLSQEKPPVMNKSTSWLSDDGKKKNQLSVISHQALGTRH